MTVTLATINTAAADLISKAGWTQRTERDDAGRVCLTGALRFCQPQPGDAHLAHGVYRSLDHGEAWNDDAGRTAEEVVAWLREHPVTDDLLAVTYGPQWEAVVAFVRQAASITDYEAQSLGAAWVGAGESAAVAAAVAARDAARDAAWGAAQSAAWYAVWEAAAVAARDAARNTAWYAAQNAAWEATQDAAIALVVRDLLLATPDGTGHYKTLTRPWAGTVGPVHPDDGPVTS